MSDVEVHPSICRICTAACPVLVTVEDGRPIKVTGNPASASYDGYSCPKGRAMAAHHTDSGRLLSSQRRRPDGGYESVPSLQAVDEITERLQGIINRHGPESVAMYVGSGMPPQFFGAIIGGAFFEAIKSPMMFSASSIDKPAERIAMALHGKWQAGLHSFSSSDTWLAVGANPVISNSSGAPCNNPGMRLKEAVGRGMRLIVIDPRRTETARRAAIHLQAKPGEDPTILAGLIRIIIDEGLFDREFVERNAVGFAALKAAVAPFDTEYVSERAGIAQDQLLAAARTFAGAKRGGAIASTGPSFSPRGNVTYYLVACLNTLCGRWTRAGEPEPQPNVLLPAFTPRAQPQAPYPVFGDRAMRVKGLRQSASGLPAAALADEMLLEGEGQIKALFCIGGNPMSSWPDHRKTETALRGLELLVQFDPVMSATAKLAHYVIASRMALEVPATSYLGEMTKYMNPGRGFEVPWGQYTPPAAMPPPGADLIDEHEVFFRMAQTMGLELNLVGAYGHGAHSESPPLVVPLDMTRIPTIDELWELMTQNSRIPLEEVKRHPDGAAFDEPVIVQPREEGCTAMLQIGDPLIMSDLAAIAAENFRNCAATRQYPYRLISRRDNNVMNSILVGLPVVSRNKTYNPVFIHPDDLASLGLSDGNLVKVRSETGEVLGIVEADDSLRPGVIAMSHGFGGHGREQERDPYLGSNVNLLLSNDEDFDPITGIPRMSSVPVALERYDSSIGAVA